MKKLLVVFMLIFAMLLCGCKEKDVEILSVAGEMGTTYYTIKGSDCLNGLDYETAEFNVAVPKIEDDVLLTCIATYNPKINTETPKTTPYVLAEDCLFYTRDSDIVHERSGDIKNEVVYKALTKEKFMKKYKKAENPKMYLWLNDMGEVSIAMLYTVTSTRT